VNHDLRIRLISFLLKENPFIMKHIRDLAGGIIVESHKAINSLFEILPEWGALFFDAHLEGVSHSRQYQFFRIFFILL
jgi:hypothetical protein